MAIAAAGHHRDALDLIGSFPKDDRVRVDPLANPLDERLHRHRLRQPTADADPGELVIGLDAELTRDESVVADLRVGVEREVVSRERDVAGEECFESPFHPLVDYARVAVPEDPVVDDEELGAELGRSPKQLARR